jgi:hypothetical protein
MYIDVISISISVINHVNISKKAKVNVHFMTNVSIVMLILMVRQPNPSLDQDEGDRMLMEH